MSRKLPFAGLLAVLAGLTLSACAAGRRPTGAHSPVDVARVYRQFAQCIREHGHPDFPDPTVDSHGQPQLPPGVEKPPENALAACGSIPASIRSGHQDQLPDPAMMRRLAQCTREHGIDDWPEPDAEGVFHFPPALSSYKSGPRWPRIHDAMTGPCKQYNPTGHIEATS